MLRRPGRLTHRHLPPHPPPCTAPAFPGPLGLARSLPPRTPCRFLLLQAAELMVEMDLVQFKDRWVHVEACSAKTGDGLEQGMQKLMEQKASKGA